MPMRTYMKKIKVTSKKLADIVDKIEKENKELSTIHKVLVKADKERQKLAFKIQRLKDKGAKVLDEVLQKQYDMDELDYSGAMETKGREVEVTMHNVFDDNYDEADIVRKRMIEQKKKKEGMWADKLMFTGHKKK